MVADDVSIFLLMKKNMSELYSNGSIKINYWRSLYLPVQDLLFLNELGMNEPIIAVIL